MRLQPMRAAILGLMLGSIHGAELSARAPALTTEAMCREAFEWGFRTVGMERTSFGEEMEMRRTLMNLRLETIMRREQVREDLRPMIREGCGIYLSGAADYASLTRP